MPPIPSAGRFFPRAATLALLACAVVAFAPSTRAAEPTIDPSVLAFAQRIQQGIDHHDPQPLIDAIDVAAIGRIATAGIPAPPGLRASTIKGMAESDGISNMVDSLVQGRYQFRFAHVVNGQTRLLFRYIGDSGLNYQDYVVQHRPDDSLEITDFYILLTGEMFSQTLRVPYALAVAEHMKNATFIRQVLGADNSVIDAISKLTAIAALFKAKHYKEALDAIDALPPSVQKIKMILMIRFQCAEKYYGAGSPQSAAVVDDIRAALPDDPAVNFLAVDSYIVRKQYDRADEALANVNVFAGGHDGYVDVLRANVQKDAGHTTAAIHFADLATTDEPTLADGYLTRLGLALEAHDNDTTAAMLTALRDRLHLRFHDLRTIPAYADFIKSPQFAAWENAAPDNPTTTK